MTATKRFNPLAVRRVLLEGGFKPWQLRRFAYRPFDIRWLYWEPTTKLLDEKREDFVARVPLPCPILIAQQKTRMGVNYPQVVSVLPDLAFMDRGATSFPIIVMSRTETLLDPNHVKINLSQASHQYISEVNGEEHDLFFHALATMQTPQFRDENAGALLNDWPRIPLPATAELLTHSATLGRRLADLLDPESDIHLQAEWSFLARFHLPPEFTGGVPGRERPS